jgi:cytochrome c biogenesis protein CcmG, thiol:disulfide interchange protein DsbE
MKGRLFLPLVLFAGLAVVLGADPTPNPREGPSPLIGRPAPPLTLPSLHGSGRALAVGDLKGRVWLLNVWASWCAPCREEHPLLVALAREQRLPIVGLNYKDDPRNAQEWLLRLGDPYQASISDRDGRVGIDYGVYGVPETFVIDKTGIVRFKHVGPLTYEVWTRTLRPLIHALQG